MLLFLVLLIVADERRLKALSWFPRDCYKIAIVHLILSFKSSGKGLFNDFSY